jgi:hypothetical protein
MPARVPIVTVAGLDNPQAVVDEGLRRSFAATVAAAWVLTVDDGLELGFPDETPPDVVRARVLDRLNELRPYWREELSGGGRRRSPSRAATAPRAILPETRSREIASTEPRQMRLPGLLHAALRARAGSAGRTAGSMVRVVRSQDSL